MPACDNCGDNLRSDATFCVSCGTSQTAGARENEPSDSVTPRTCSRCGNEFDATPGWRVCSSCRKASERSSLIRVREQEADDAATTDAVLALRQEAASPATEDQNASWA